MLPQEFFERTGVNLTGEEYAEVEHIYNSVQMEKDEFCQLWLQNRENKIIAELMNTIKKLEDECQKATRQRYALTIEMEQMKTAHQAEIDQDSLMHRNKMENFGKEIIKAGEFDFPSDIYRVVEEEFGLPFIIKTKYENNISLEDEEVEFMIKKLD